MQPVTEAAIGFGLSALVVVLLGPVVIPILRRLKLGQTIRSDGPQSHLKKAGTPTMGGIMIIVAIVCVSVCRMRVLFAMGATSEKSVLALCAAISMTLLHAFLGFFDDYLKVAKRRPLGLRARQKLLIQIVAAVVFGLVVVGPLALSTAVTLPFVGIEIDLGRLYPLFVVLMVVATTNAMNLTDGADGLAAGASTATFLAMVLVSLTVGDAAMTVFSACCGGAALGFLWHNHYPAKVIMGDTGALALGAALVSVSVLTKTELLLPILGGLYLLEAVSVIAQVVSFKTTGKRVLKMAPLHHHYELLGYKESSVTFAFWLVSLAFGALGLYGLRGLGR